MSFRGLAFPVVEHATKAVLKQVSVVQAALKRKNLLVRGKVGRPPVVFHSLRLTNLFLR